MLTSIANYPSQQLVLRELLLIVRDLHDEQGSKTEGKAWACFSNQPLGTNP
jgi:hypothetical protein